MPVVDGTHKHYTPECILLFSVLLIEHQCSFHFYICPSLSPGCVTSLPQAVCEVRAKGVFPALQVIDVCSGGSVGRLSKVRLWKLFSLDSLNEYILSNPSPAELTDKTPTRHR